MLFQTATFGVLFLVTLAAFYGLPQRFRLYVLAAASLTFYAAGGLLDFVLLLLTLAFTYLLSRHIQPGGSRWPLVAGVLLLFGSLAYFKYDDFIYQNVNAALGGAGLPKLPRFGGNILPLGISFYTFQVVAYLVDLYRGRTQVAQHFLHYLVFIMFFGQLIAGPIMRASEFLHQLINLRGGTGNDFRVGTALILIGLIKKVVLADGIARLVDVRFSAADTLTQADAWVAAYLFAFQIFFDFSGYVSIALGLGRMFGLRLTENFRTPYLSRNPSEFWGRWHITLSQWFRDYLYIPLGGNRRGKAREITNLMLVMTIAGLWHGAGWTFILWGAFHGVLLSVSRFIPSRQLQSWLPLPAAYRTQMYGLVAGFIFFHLMVLAWIPFRAPDLTTTLIMVGHALRWDGLGVWLAEARLLLVVVIFFGMHVAERLVMEYPSVGYRIRAVAPSAVQGLGMAAIVLLIVLSSGGERSYLYFRF